MRIVCCAGIDPIRFYDLTLDEAIIAFRGKVDEWRIFRNGVNLIHCSLVEKRANILEVMPFPFDEDISDQGEDMFEDYNRNREQLIKNG